MNMAYHIIIILYRIWDYSVSSEPRQSHQNHSDCVYGLDISPSQDGLMADCGWDAEARVFRARWERPGPCRPFTVGTPGTVRANGWARWRSPTPRPCRRPVGAWARRIGEKAAPCRRRPAVDSNRKSDRPALRIPVRRPMGTKKKNKWCSGKSLNSLILPCYIVNLL